MKSLEQWFSEYGVSHQNPTNKLIHYICVPSIYFSIIGLLQSIPSTPLQSLLNLHIPVIENWAFVTFLFVLFFYVRLSVSMSLKIAVFTLACLFINQWISQKMSLALFSLGLFSVAWIGQFYGHKVEGKKPSFFQDLQFLLIGPAWVVENLFAKKNK